MGGKYYLFIVMFSPQKVLVVTQTEVQHIIQERMKELQELKHNVEVLKVSNKACSYNMAGEDVSELIDIKTSFISWLYLSELCPTSTGRKRQDLS